MHRSMFALVPLLCLVGCGGSPNAELDGLLRFGPDGEIDAVLAAYDSAESPGCALGVIENGDFVYQRGYGMANLEHGIPLNADSVFRIGSVSKQFTAMVILLLDEAGGLSLDDDVRDVLAYVPDYGLTNTITIRRLLHHTSGLRDYLVLMRLGGFRDEDFYTDAQIIEMLSRQAHLNFEPGAEHLYSNTGYFLLGQIVEAVTGQSLRDVARELIFRPLGMDNTHFHNNLAHIVERRASGYAPLGGGGTGFEISMTSLEMIGDGGVFTTVNDLLAWDRNFYDNKLGEGDPALIDRWLQRGVLNDGEVLDYAAGIADSTYRGLRLISHGGAFVGFRADMLRFPDQRTSIITLCNLATTAPSRLARRVADVVLGDQMTEPAPTASSESSGEMDEGNGQAEMTLPVAELRAYTGAFYSPELNITYELAIDDGRLVMYGPRLADITLTSSTPDHFRGREWPLVIRFLRDGGQAIGFFLDAGRVVNIRFERR